jgi:hypothetical protein
MRVDILLVEMQGRQFTHTRKLTKSSVFLAMTPCIPLKGDRRLGGTCRLHLQGRRISHERHQREESSSMLRYVSEDGTFHNHLSENLRSYKKNNLRTPAE